MTTDATPKRPPAEAVGGHARRGGLVWRFLRQLAVEIWNDRIGDVGAMMTYYAILALFPMLVFVVTIGLLVVDRDTIQQGVAMATEAMPRSTRELIDARVDQFVRTANPGFAVGSAVLALWGASRAMVSLSGALNAILQKTETRGWLHRQLLAIGVTLLVTVVMVVALGLLVVGPTVGHWAADRAGLGAVFDVVWHVGRWVAAGLLVMFVWALLYRTLPDTDAPLRVFTPGAFVGVLLWLGLSWLFGLYLRHWGAYEATYGAFGTAIIFLTWMWLSNVALLVGAELNDVLADFRKHRSTAAARLANPE